MYVKQHSTSTMRWIGMKRKMMSPKVATQMISMFVVLNTYERRPADDVCV
jgi:hypothetical protein